MDKALDAEHDALRRAWENTEAKVEALEKALDVATVRRDTLEHLWSETHKLAGINPNGGAGLWGWIVSHREILATLLYWRDQGHIDESLWDEAAKIQSSAK